MFESFAVDRLLQGIYRTVDFPGLHVYFRTPAPNHDAPVEAVSLLEIRNIGLERIEPFAQPGGALHISAVEVLDEPAVKNGFHGNDSAQEVFDRVEVFSLEHACVKGGFEAVGLIDVPSAENQVIQARQGDKILYFRGPVFEPLAEPDGAELGKRTYRFSQSAPNKFNARNESGADRASNTGDENPKLTLRGRDLFPLFQALGFQDKPSISSHYPAYGFSRSSKALFISSPQEKPPSFPPLAMTLWHGMRMGTGFLPHARPTALEAPGLCVSTAIWP